VQGFFVCAGLLCVVLLRCRARAMAKVDEKQVALFFEVKPEPPAAGAPAPQNELSSLEERKCAMIDTVVDFL
jgi:hypothetical protein